MKILIADDHADLRRLVRMTLDTGHLHFLDAGDGITALRLAQRELPGLLE